MKGMNIMRKFNITVNGKTYEVDVEEVGGASYSPAPVKAAETTAPAASAPAAQKAAPISAPAGATISKAPMPGTILEVKVKQGDSVKTGDVLCILEAMKMENEIVAEKDGTVSAVSVSKGASVNTGDILVAY